MAAVFRLREDVSGARLELCRKPLENETSLLSVMSLHSPARDDA